MPTSTRRSAGSGSRGGGSALSSSSYFASSFASSSSSSSSYSTSSSSSMFFDHHHQHHQHQRSASPTRVHFVGSSPPRRSSTVSFSLDQGRPASPGQSLPAAAVTRAPVRRTCMCSPTTHPGSFRCSLHKGLPHNGRHHQAGGGAASSSSNRLNARRSAMANSLVRIGTVEGEWVKRALAALIRPSSHHQRRRGDFQPRPSRLSVMSKAEDP